LSRLGSGKNRNGDEHGKQGVRSALATVGAALLVGLLIYQFQMQQDANAQQSKEADFKASELTDMPMSVEASEQTTEPADEQADLSSDLLSTESDSSVPTEHAVAIPLEVPLIMQLPELPTGCEAAAVAMLLQYAGSTLTKIDVAEMMPYSNDPYQGFVGNPWTEDGYTIYPQALMSLVYEQLGSAIDLTGATLADLWSYLQAGKPVVCWTADDLGYVHCVVVTGYAEDTIYLNDPLSGATGMSAADFDHIWSNNARRALSY
jgi:uncharacterized protein YvpB